MARMEKGQYRFTVRKSDEGRPFIVLAPITDADPAFSDALLSLGLKGDTTLAYAQQITQLLNDNIVSLSVTFFEGGGHITDQSK